MAASWNCAASILWTLSTPLLRHRYFALHERYVNKLLSAWTLCLPVLFVIQPVRCTHSSSVPTQLRCIDSYSDSPCFFIWLQIRQPLPFKWGVLIYNTLMSSTKQAEGLADHCLTAVQRRTLKTNLSLSESLTFRKESLARVELLHFF